jgi:hypothetical protein
MMKFPIYGKIKHVPNHQPDSVAMSRWMLVKSLKTSFFGGLAP